MTTYGIIVFAGYWILIALFICAEALYVKYANTRKITACVYKFLRAHRMRKIAYFIASNL